MMSHSVPDCDWFKYVVRLAFRFGMAYKVVIQSNSPSPVVLNRLSR
jgi:hypothetical protein